MNPRKTKIQTNFEIETKFEKFEHENQASNRSYYRCLAHDLDVNEQAYQFTQSSLTELANTYDDLAVLLGHNTQDIGFGKTEAGIISENGMEMKFFILRDVTFGGTNSSDIITALDEGTINRVSIGFSIKEVTCSICGEDMWDWDKCQHVRGRTYQISQGDSFTKKTCIGMIQDSEGRELSLVYLGADRDAKVIAKLEALFEDGVVDETVLTNYKQSTQIEEDLPVSTNTEMQHENELLKAKNETLQAQLTNTERRIEDLESQAKALREDSAKTQTYKDEAELARQRAVDEFGVQYTAHKDGVTEEKCEEMKEAVKPLPLPDIYEQTDSWRKIADERFKAGRSSLPGTETDKTKAIQKRMTIKRLKLKIYCAVRFLSVYLNNHNNELGGIYHGDGTVW